MAEAMARVKNGKSDLATDIRVTESDIVDDVELDIEDLEKQIKDTDFEEFNEFLEAESEEDMMLFDIGDDD